MHCAIITPYEIKKLYLKAPLKSLLIYEDASLKIY